MKRCKTCKYFNIDDEQEVIGSCSNGKFVYTGEVSRIDNDGLGYWDYESYSADFAVGADFGCIHHVDR